MLPPKQSSVHYVKYTILILPPKQFSVDSYVNIYGLLLNCLLNIPVYIHTYVDAVLILPPEQWKSVRQ